MEGQDDRIWLGEYPPGVPADIDATGTPSLQHILHGACEQFGDRVAFRNFDATLSYAELERRTREFAAWLQSRGLGRGDCVAIMMPNCLQYPVCLFGALRAGCVVSNVNPLYTATELHHQLSDSDAKALVVLENFATTAQQVLPQLPGIEHVVVTGLGDLFPTIKGALTNFVVRHIKRMVPKWELEGHVPLKEALAAGVVAGFDEPDLGPDDLAFLQYTGGTTGVSKGAMLSHGNMVSNVLQASAWLEPQLGGEDEVVVTALPLYHIFALCANLMVFFRVGAENLLITNPRDMPAFIKTLQKNRFTAMTGVNTLFNGLLNADGFSELDFRDFKVALGGGMAVQRAVAERWRETTGHPLLEAYGLTETCPAVCINPLDLEEFNGSIGVPIPSTRVTIRGEDGNVLPIGEVGELCVHGPQVMQGYWKRPAETAEVMLPGGWLRTGDIARMDEKGYVYIEDRKKDMILVSGFNVYPNEVEACAASHPKVVEAAAIGVPHERSGEAVKLFVVRKDDSLSAEELKEFMAEKLTNYKRPKWVEFRDELPKTNVGKILRRELREEEESGAERADG